MLDHLHTDDLVVSLELDRGHALRVAAHRPHLGLPEAGGLALAGGDDDVVLAVGQADPLELVAVEQVDGDQAVGADLRVLGQRGLLDLPLARGHDQVVIRLELRQADDRADVLALLHLHPGQVDDR